MRSSLYTLRGFKLAFALAHLLPRPVAQRIAVVIGRISYARRPHVRTRLRENLGLATNRSRAALSRLCARNIANFSRTLADYFLCSGMDATRVVDSLLAEWHGYEHLTVARAAGKGVIVVTGHIGNWELGALILARRGLPLTIITLEEPSSELTRWRERVRRSFGIRTITVGPGHPFAFVEMIRVLRANELLAMLVDRPYADTGAPVEIFGRATAFSTAPALLAQHTGAAVVPAFVLQKNCRYVSFAEPAVPMETSDDRALALQTNTQRIATKFESIIRQHPEQWFNYAPLWSSSHPA